MCIESEQHKQWDRTKMTTQNDTERTVCKSLQDISGKNSFSIVNTSYLISRSNSSFRLW